MAGMFANYDPNQMLLLPPSLQDWLPEGHLAYFISEAVDQLDLSEIERAYRSDGSGNVAFHPRMMVKLLVYGYATGVFSSRRIARHIDENIAFRVLAAGQRPSHRTISRFRQEHIERFAGIFMQVVQIACESGMANVGTVAVDGSKFKANASKHKAMSYDRMKQEEKRLKAEIGALIDAAESEDSLEDGKFGPDFRGDELPQELQRRQSRIATITAARKRLEARKREEAEKKSEDDDRSPKGGGGSGSAKPKDSDQENFTDPDSRIMKTSSGGFEQCYNAQIAVDSSAQIVVAAEITQSAVDSKQLIPMVDAITEIVGAAPKLVLADAGYRSEENFQKLEHRQVKAVVSLGREGRVARPISDDLPATARMKKRLQTKRGRRRYATRKHIVEPVFGWVKRCLGFRAFSMRGLAAVSGEWKLVCLALNLRRLEQRIEFKW